TGGSSDYSKLQLEEGPVATLVEIYATRMDESKVHLPSFLKKLEALAQFAARTVPGKNIFNPAEVREGLGLDNEGEIVTAPGFSVSGKMDVRGQQHLTIKGNIQYPEGVKVRFENAAGGKLGVYNANSAHFFTLPATVPLPANCANVIMTTKGGGYSDYTSIQVEYGEVSTETEPFRLVVATQDVDLRPFLPMSELEEQYVRKTKPGKNILDKSKIKEGRAVTPTGDLVNNAAYSSIETDVRDFKVLTYSGNMENARFARVRFQDAQNQKISVFNPEDQQITALPFSFPLPDGCTSIVVNTKNDGASDYDTLQLEAGTTATEHEDYHLVAASQDVDLSKKVDKDDPTLVKADRPGTNLIKVTDIREGLAVDNEGNIIAVGSYSIYRTPEDAIEENEIYTLQGEMTYPEAVKIRFEGPGQTFLGIWNAYSSKFLSLPASFPTPPGCVSVVINTKTGGSSDYSKL
ncbi:hypothetical protein BWI93_19065, partial [Siphonobacter sp. BAB-5385]|uniref:hypothetical protein n=1 Tax=Siphonobacter sp. BAB-5385 TaxID=1864822 RepID=UPI000BDB908F